MQVKKKNYLRTALRTMGFLMKTAPKLLLLLLLFLGVQALVPIVVTTAITRFIDGAMTFTGIGDSLPILLPLFIALALDAMVGPLVMMIQGELTDLVAGTMNDELHGAIDKINTLAVLDDPTTYHRLELLRQEIAYRPVNLLIYSMSIFRMCITLLIIFIQLASYSFFIPVILFISLLPQSVALYKLQVEAFENTVYRSPLARRLHYFSEVLLKRNYAQERLVYRFADTVRKKYRDTFQTIYEASKRDRRRITIASEWIALGSVIALILLTLYFFRQVLVGVFSLGALAMFLQYMRLASLSSFQLIQEGALLMDTMLFMDHYFDFLGEDRNLKEGNLPLRSIKTIECRGVSFTYPGRKEPALKDINFHIEAPWKVAIVGVNGSGKTTLLKLLLRLYDPDQGEILVNDHPISAYKIEDVRKAFGVLFQDFGRFSWSAEENITIARPETKEKDMASYEMALKTSGAKEVMEELPHGEETYLGKLYDEGVELSGGQWQKIATARAFYREGDGRMFDEPSAALDPLSEKHFWDRLLAWSDNKLTLFTSHRLHGLQKADWFLVLNKGVLEQQGTFEDVYEVEGVFRQLYDAQAKAQEK